MNRKNKKKKTAKKQIFCLSIIFLYFYPKKMILDSKILDFLSEKAKHIHPELEELTRETYLKVLMPQMISSKEQGTLLYLLTQMQKPKLTVEIGTFTGYATICMALAINPPQKIITIDIDEERKTIAEKYFKKLHLQEKIQSIYANALNYMNHIDNKSVDMFFLDADKKNYPAYAEILIEKCAPEGLVVIDNVLWKGKVADQECQDKDTLAIREAVDIFANHPDFITVILPLRDGVLLARRNN